jgi:hypothetical protein
VLTEHALHAPHIGLAPDDARPAATRAQPQHLARAPELALKLVDPRLDALARGERLAAL